MADIIKITLFSIVLVFGAMYPFLPEKFKTSRTKLVLMLSVFLTTALTIHDFIEEYDNKIYAHITKDGQVKDSRNFQWKLSKEMNDDRITYLINDLHVDVSQISLVTELSSQEYSLYKAYGGVAIKFYVEEESIKEFDIKIKNAL